MGEKSGKNIPVLPHNLDSFGKGRNVGITAKIVSARSTGFGHYSI
jgi:hypothetical protein